MNKSKIHHNPRDDWETPRKFFDLVSEMAGGFDLDAAASAKNALCPNYYTIKDDALTRPWYKNTWCNPPYSRKLEFIHAAFVSAVEDGARVVMLLPASTDTQWFHYGADKASQIAFVRGRLQFSGKSGNPHGSVLMVFGERVLKQCDRWLLWERE